MKQTIIALAAAVLMAAALPSSAQARCQGCGIAASVVAGAAAGAIIGGAIANGPPVYAPPSALYVEPAPGYAPPPPIAYAAPGGVEPPDYAPEASCHMERQQVWDGYAYRIRRVEVCE
jgi:hypothetical protein